MKPATPLLITAIAVTLGVSGCGGGASSAAGGTGSAVPATGPAPTAGAAGPSAAAAAAAGQGGASAASTNGATSCGYLTLAQLTSIEGSPYTKPPTIAYGICSWIGDDGNSIMITVTKNASALTWQSTLATIVADQSSGSTKPIAGLGDKAAGVGLEIAVQKGSTIIDVRGADSPGFGKWPKSTAIANAIIAGLG